MNKRRRHRLEFFGEARNAWTIAEWCVLVGGINRGTVYNLHARNEIEIAKVGNRSLIITSPQTYLASRVVPPGQLGVAQIARRAAHALDRTDSQ
jgi:hypothetical protein